jgi:membrane protein YdbS with pleckstrin-like domain
VGRRDRFLNEGEQIALAARPHWWYLAGPVALALVLLVGAVIAFVQRAPGWSKDVVAGALVLGLLWLVGRYLRWRTTSLVVTSDRLILRRGVLGRVEREILLDKLSDITCRRSLLDRLVGAGDLLLESPGRDGQEVIADIAHPARVQNEIYHQIELRHRGPAAAGWAGSPPTMFGEPTTLGALRGEPDVATQLQQLDELRRRGVISRREFAAKKAELLDRM